LKHRSFQDRDQNVFKISEKRREISYIKRTKFANSIFLLSYPIFGGVYDMINEKITLKREESGMLPIKRLYSYEVITDGE